MPQITPFLWFDHEAEEAAAFYISVFPNSRITQVSRYSEAGPGPAGSVMVVAFELDGTPVLALNGGASEAGFNRAVSLTIPCRDQAEVDHYWDGLIAGGGRGIACGWLEDRYGLPWQVVPDRLGELMSDPDPDRARRANEAMLGMTKLDVAALERAADGVPA